MLLTEIKSLQNEYRSLLINTLNNWDNENIKTALNEIIVFWYKNRRRVNCALNYATAPFKSYLFTGTSIFDIDNNEHYPFLCFGDFHIWDDPIYSYIKILQHTDNKKINTQFKSQIKKTIESNIKIIDTLNDYVFILPARMLSESTIDSVHDLANKAFLALFKDDITLEDYNVRFSDIDDVLAALHPYVLPMIVFDDDSESFINVKDRFLHYRKNSVLPLPDNASDTMVFWAAVYSYFSQVIDILTVCLNFKLVPYLCYSVTFKYMLLFAGNFLDNTDISELLFKCAISHTLYEIFDTNRYSKIPIPDFCIALQNGEFEQSVFSHLKNENITINTPHPIRAAKIIEQELLRCLSDNFNQINNQS